MKKLKSLTLLAVCLAFALATGCVGNSNNSNPDVTPGTIGKTDANLLAASDIAKRIDPTGDKVLVFYYRPDKSYSNWGCWIWKLPGGSGEAGYNATVGKAIVEGDIAYWNMSTLVSSLVQTAITGNNDLGLIIRDAAWTKDPGADQKLELSSGARHFMIISGDSNVYVVKNSFEPLILSASSLSKDSVKVSLSVTYGLGTEAGDSGFVIEDQNGMQVTVSDSVNYEAQNDRLRNNTKTVLLKTATPLATDITYFVKHASFAPASGVKIGSVGIVKDAPEYKGNDLGLTLSGTKATFKTWAPLAKSVTLLLYTDSTKVGTFKGGKSSGSLKDAELKGTPSSELQMVKDPATSVWSYTVDDISSHKYYKFIIENGSDTYYVSDIWGKACSAEAIASQIVDINTMPLGIPSSSTDNVYGTKAGYYNPFGKSGTEEKSYSDAVIYEMHVTDWSYAESKTTTANVGKYLTIANGTKVIKHVKELGVTHVQILPVFEFAETNDDSKYNWGYNPYHYNVPEGRYVTTGYTDGIQAVKELRELIAKFHEDGIAVNMDVVYNHTAGTKDYSLYDSTVPTYFYRMDADGAYSNGSGCGNEIDTEAPMAKKYIIESLKNWMLDYHFNGFRFDLMGCIAKETMAEIYDALREIDPNVLVYGEPWTGGDSKVVNGASQAVSSSHGFGAGAFDDDFRDAIKGSEFNGFRRGHVQDANNDMGVVTGLTGKSGRNKRNETGVLGLRINYVECHDNYTLFDKLAISKWQKLYNKPEKEVTTGNLFAPYIIGTDGLDVIKSWDKLAASYVFLAQGMAFMNGGQEFLRTKQGNENSYDKPIAFNGIDLDFKTNYIDVYNTYKGLIALRQSDTKTFGGNASAKATRLSPGVTKYETGDYCVYFNASDSEISIDNSGYSKFIEVSSGAVVEKSALPDKVASKDFVILKK